MSGHSHWAGIKHKKEITDQKRGKVFSKLLAAVSVAAKTEANPDFNPRLRTAIEKAKEVSVPQENIERAIKHAPEAGRNMEELTFEAYGPGGAAILIEATSDNRNRTVAEIKKILSDSGGKWAEAGGVRWAFEPGKERGEWVAKFTQELSSEDKSKLEELISAVEEHEDIQNIYANVAN